MAVNIVQEFNVANGHINGTSGQGGIPLDVGRFTHKSLQLIIPGGSFRVQISNENVSASFVDLGGARTSDAILDTEANSGPTDRLLKSFRFLRIFTTTANAGARALFSGHDPA